MLKLNFLGVRGGSWNSGILNFCEVCDPPAFTLVKVNAKLYHSLFGMIGYVRRPNLKLSGFLTRPVILQKFGEWVGGGGP